MNEIDQLKKEEKPRFSSYQAYKRYREKNQQLENEEPKETHS
jgi:hypothetical protein